MQYQIFEIIPKRRFERDGYDMKSINNYTLEQENYPEIFDTFEIAQSHIQLNSDMFKKQKVTILPVFDIDYEGNIMDEDEY